MSRIAFTGNPLGSGTVTITSPDTNSDRTVTLPDTTGTLYIAGGNIGTPSGGNASNLTNLNASNLSTGTVPDARFPATLPAASGANLTALNASNLGSGTVPDARFPATLPAASGANLTSLNASNLGSGTVPDARFPATLPAASGANLTSLNASNLTTGTVATARLGSGTANSTTFLRGDQTWVTVSGYTPAYAAVGSTFIGFSTSATASSVYNPGLTVAGSSLRGGSALNAPIAQNISNSESSSAPNPGFGGTWVNLQRFSGQTGYGSINNSMWMRIS